MSAAKNLKSAEPFYTKQAKEDRAYWEKRDRRVSARIDQLIVDILEHPHAGIGKPEPLKHNWSGYWSRRITGDHRLVYKMVDGQLYIAQCRFHYSK